MARLPVPPFSVAAIASQENPPREGADESPGQRRSYRSMGVHRGQLEKSCATRYPPAALKAMLRATRLSRRTPSSSTV